MLLYKMNLPNFKAIHFQITQDMVEGKPIHIEEWMLASRLLALRKRPEVADRLRVGRFRCA